MLKKCLFSCVCIVLLSACSSDKSKDLEQETKDRVDRAVTLVEEKGSAAFPEFSEPEWAHDEHYVFIIDMDGTSLVHPVSPDLVGTDISDLQDRDGKYIVRDFMDKLETSDTAWSEYQWLNPAKDEIESKRTYLRKAQIPDEGEAVVVGSGYYESEY